MCLATCWGPSTSGPYSSVRTFGPVLWFLHCIEAKLSTPTPYQTHLFSIFYANEFLTCYHCCCVSSLMALWLTVCVKMSAERINFSECHHEWHEHMTQLSVPTAQSITAGTGPREERPEDLFGFACPGWCRMECPLARFLHSPHRYSMVLATSVAVPSFPRQVGSSLWILVHAFPSAPLSHLCIYFNSSAEGLCSCWLLWAASSSPICFPLPLRRTRYHYLCCGAFPSSQSALSCLAWLSFYPSSQSTSSLPSSPQDQSLHPSISICCKNI